MPITESKLFDQERVGAVLVLTLTGPEILDEKHIQILGDALFRVVDDEQETIILVDFQNITYFSAAALGKFIKLNGKTARGGGKLVLCIQDNQIHDVFEISMVDKLICVVRSRQAALEAFTKKDSESCF